MRYKGTVTLVFFLLLTACAASGPDIQRIGVASGEPTSIMVQYQTPTPSRTPWPTETLAPTSTPNEDPIIYYGGLTISLDDVGRTVEIRRLEGFLLQLGDAYDWSIELTPPDLITRNMNITPEVGDQGVFVARERGTVHLKAVGSPICRKNQPPCERPDVLFQTTIVVK